MCSRGNVTLYATFTVFKPEYGDIHLVPHVLTDATGVRALHVNDASLSRDFDAAPARAYLFLCFFFPQAHENAVHGPSCLILAL